MTGLDPSTLVPLELPTGFEPPAPGEILGKYELLEAVGQGSMGRVYLARHSLLGRKMAIKVLRPEHASNIDLVARFFQEARTVNQINHAHIVQIFDFVQEPPVHGRPGWVYCVMELLSGKSLTDRLSEGSMSVSEILLIAGHVCSALDAVHQVGVIHRDIKPDNIFVTRHEGTPFAKVLDFGVAKLSHHLGELPAMTTTQQGLVIGTPAYMSPEQAAGLEIDSRTDLYAVGVVLFEALSGRVPFTSANFGQLLVEIITGKVPNLPRRTPAGEAISPDLAALVRRCLAKKAKDRPQSVAELGGELARIAEGGSRPRRPLRRVGMSVLGAAALAGLFGFAQHRRAPAVPASAGDDVVPEFVAAPVTPAAAEPSPTVSVSVKSDPPGATVVRVDTGAAWGQTPFTATVPREAREIQVQLRLPGFISEASSVRLDSDSVVTVALRAEPPTPAPVVPVASKVSRRVVSHDSDIDPFAP